MRNKPDQPLVAAALAATAFLLAMFRRPPHPPPARPRGQMAVRPTQRSTPASSGRAGAGGNGHAADTPSEIPARGWWDVLKRVARQISDNRLMTEAAAVTFYTLLSVFPALAALISIYGLIADPSTVTNQISALSGVLPGGGVELLTNQAQKLAGQGSTGLSLGLGIGIATSLWTSNQAMKALFEALNVVNEEEEKRGFLLRTAVTLAFTLGVILFTVVALAAVVAVPVALGYLGLGGTWEFLLRWLRWPLLLVVVAVLLALIYRFGPSREEARWRWISWGSAFASVTWIGGSLLFSWYVSNFGNYDKTYGSLGAVVGFMTWIWLSALVVLIGGQLNAELEFQTAKDTTTGPQRPIGSRGAVAADEVAGD